jgi:hypothetical protein
MQKDPNCLSLQISVSHSKSASTTVPGPLCNFTVYLLFVQEQILFVDHALLIKT